MLPSSVSVAVLGLVAFCLLVCIGFILSMNSNTKLKSEIDYYNSTYLRKQGVTVMLTKDALNYDLRSFDGGKIWYAVESDSNGVKILGQAEKIYPGLLKHISAWDALTKYAEKHGAVKPGDTTGINLLKDIGFQVEIK